jgi:hypothetical protein
MLGTKIDEAFGAFWRKDVESGHGVEEFIGHVV